MSTTKGPLSSAGSALPATLSAADIERAKTDMQKAEDIAYTINHTITCLTLDLIKPFALAWYTTRRFEVDFGDNVKSWFTGEIIGDLGALPMTIGFQRFAPGFMDSLNKGLGTVFGPVYRWGAERSTSQWALEHGIAADSAEYKQHADALYKNEVSHLSQAAMWTVGAFALNVITQKSIGGLLTTRQIVEGKMLDALAATGTVLTSRAIAPESAHKWDQYTSQKVFLPMTKYVGGLFGIDEKTVERMAQKEGLLDAPVSKAGAVAHQGQISPLPGSPIKQ